MSIMITTIVIAVLAATSLYFAYRERQRALATKCSVEIRESVLSDCGQILDDREASQSLKIFVSHVATMSLSNEFLYRLGTNPDLFQATAEDIAERKRTGQKIAYETLSNEDRDRVRPIMMKISFASLVFNHEHARAVHCMVKEGRIEAVIKQMMNPSPAQETTNNRRAKAVARVTSRVPQVERIVAADLCPA